jgi:undecaprenyl-diphosphatase
MIHFLSSTDTAIFFFFNQTISNPVTDFLWPLITEYSGFLVVRVALLGVWALLMIWGGTRGRTAALLCVIILVASDQLSSFVIKPLLSRPRPCHEVGGVPVLEGVRLLVNCGSGKSFPSSHAVNNFAMAALFSFYYRRWSWAFFSWATLVALSRVAVGVHYPSDVAGGAVIGVAVALAIIALWTMIQRRYFPRLAVVSAGDPYSGLLEAR